MINLATAQAKLYGLGIVGVVVAILGIGYVMKGCGKPDKPKIPPATQHTLDSLNVTKPTFDSTQHATQDAVARDTIITIIHEKASTALLLDARRTHLLADSLARIAAVAQDSGHTWKLAYDARTHEVDTLLIAVSEGKAALASERSARILLAGAYNRDTLRRIETEKVNRDLVDAIGKLEQPCHVLRFLGCPSRTTVAVASALAGVSLGYAVHKP